MYVYVYIWVAVKPGRCAVVGRPTGGRSPALFLEYNCRNWVLQRPNEGASTLGDTTPCNASFPRFSVKSTGRCGNSLFFDGLSSV